MMTPPEPDRSGVSFPAELGGFVEEESKEALHGEIARFNPDFRFPASPEPDFFAVPFEKGPTGFELEPPASLPSKR